MAEPITHADILAAFERCRPTQGTGGVTALEIAIASGRHVQSVRREIGRALAAGLLEQAWEPRMRIDGRSQMTSVYRVVKPPEPKKKSRGKVRAS